jgi:hypothetical protein
MKHKVDEKQSKLSGNKTSYSIGLWTVESRKWVDLPVEQDDFDRINVGDTIEILINLIQPEPAAA